MQSSLIALMLSEMTFTTMSKHNKRNQRKEHKYKRTQVYAENLDIWITNKKHRDQQWRKNSGHQRNINISLSGMASGCTRSSIAILTATSPAKRKHQCEDLLKRCGLRLNDIPSSSSMLAGSKCRLFFPRLLTDPATV